MGGWASVLFFCSGRAGGRRDFVVENRVGVGGRPDTPGPVGGPDLHECVVGCPILSSMNAQVPINHRGVGIDLLYYSCSSLCYVIQPVYHVLHECVVGCPLLSTSKYEACPDQSSRRRHQF